MFINLKIKYNLQRHTNIKKNRMVDIVGSSRFVIDLYRWFSSFRLSSIS